MSWGGLVCLMLGAAATLGAQQGFEPDEMRAHSEPYVPPPPPNVLRTQVNLVEVPVVVRDGQHRAIATLKQSDFQVFDAGKKQAITAFSVETFTPAAAGAHVSRPQSNAAGPTAATATDQHPPRYVMLCFDTLSPAFDELKRTKDAAERFIRVGLAPGDLVAVLTTAFSHDTTFTADIPKLIESIEKITPQLRISDETSHCPRITAYQAYVIANRMDNETLEGVAAEDMACKNLQHGAAIDDVTSLSRMIWEHAKSNSANTLYSLQSMVDALGKMPGRRMLLLASSGFLSGELEYQEDELIHRAVHAEVVINALDAKGLYTYNVGGRPIEAPAPRGRSVRTQIAEARIQGRQAQAKDDGMAVLALGTGGAFYHNSNDLDRGFHELGELPEAVYVLGFAPSDAAPDGRYHSLKVKLAGGNHYSVQARLGYTAPTKSPPPEQHPPSKLDVAALASDTLSEIPASMTSQPGAPENVPATGDPALTVVVHIDVGKLKFETRADRHAQKLTLVAALFDARGSFVVGMQGEVELALKAATFERLAEQGLNVRLPLSAPAGTYMLRGVVQESLEGKMSASSQPVELR